MLAWHPELVRPYESAWALLQRFQVLNRPTPGDLNTLFGKPNTGLAQFINRSNANSSYAYAGEKFEKVFGLPSSKFETLFTGFYGLDTFNPVGQFLRYCPECMRIGFHSPIYQAAALQLCPLHDREIRATCPACGGFVYYDLRNKARENPFSCSCGRALVDVADLGALLEPLPQGMVEKLNAFTSTALHVAEDPRRLHWIFDQGIHQRVDRRAFWLFAQVIGAEPEFLRFFHKGRVRLSVMGKPNPPLPQIPVDWEFNGDYDHDMLLRAHRWFRHVDNSTNGADHPFLGKVGVPQADMVYSSRWGVNSADAARSSTRWVDFWTRDPQIAITTPDTGALWGVNYSTTRRHARFNCLRKQEVEYLIDERTFRWAYRKMLTALFVGTYQLVAKVDHWTGDDYQSQDRLPPQIGRWAFPRCYLLIGKENAAMMVMESDYSCPDFRASMLNDPDPVIRDGGRKFLDYFDSKSPPVRIPPSWATGAEWSRPTPWPPVSKWNPGGPTH